METPQKERFLRIWQITGDPKRGVEPIFPISKASWWHGVKAGKYPKSIKLANRTTVWRASDIDALVEKLGART
jgi:predicted DNA-binding transcriptional regulator AlpA